VSRSVACWSICLPRKYALPRPSTVMMGEVIGMQNAE
jgi:hypothetical protein